MLATACESIGACSLTPIFGVSPGSIAETAVATAVMNRVMKYMLGGKDMGAGYIEG